MVVSMANPWGSSYVRLLDYEVLARTFGFNDMQEAKVFFETQQRKHERRQRAEFNGYKSAQ